jgi:formate dehydrogenase major subunit
MTATSTTPQPAGAITFELDGKPVTAQPGERIWDVARRLGHEIPHLCRRPEPGYRPDGNCRACMVEIEGERVLAPSCNRFPHAGMRVHTATPRVEKARRLVFELLVTDQPARATSHDPSSAFWSWAEREGVLSSRYPQAPAHTPDASHPAMRVNLDACINCRLCVMACREVQINDVIGMAYRNAAAKVAFDFDDPMGESTCVGCGECVQACPTGALMPAAYLDESQARVTWPDRTADSLCPYCGVGCHIRYDIKDEKIVYAHGIDGDSNHNRLCVKGRFGFDYIRHPHRLTKPLIRRADKPKHALDQVDPANPYTHFREAMWDEALDFAAEGFKRVKAKYGPGALAGFGSAKGSNEEAYLLQKLVRTGFGTNNVEHCTRLCHASSVVALMEAINSGAVTAPFSAALDAKLIVVIGCNPAVNHPVAATFIKNAVKQRGAKLVIVDPREQLLSRHAWRHLPFRAGSDVALLNAMLHTVIEEGLTKPEFIAARTDGFEEVKARVAEFPPERMASVCGVPAETIREVAREYARAEASLIFWGMGISQHVHGTDNVRALISLALVTGQIGRPGTGLHPLRGQNNVQGASDVGLMPDVYPNYQAVGDADVRARFEKLWDAVLDPHPGLTAVEIFDAAHEGKIRAVYVEGENPAMSEPNVMHVREAMARLDHLVVQDLFLTETACHADVILPASAFHEKSGTFTSTDRRVQLARQVVAPPGDARQDWWIIQAIARRMGLAWNYGGPSDVYREIVAVMPSLAHITWERLEREGAVIYPAPADDHPGEGILFHDAFPTANGRAKLVPAAVFPPHELPDAHYPMVLSTARILEHWHTGTMTRRARLLDDIEPEAVALMAPRELARHGVKPGGMIRVETRRGEIELKVRSDDKVPDNMVFMPFCYTEAAANLLTNDALDRESKIPEFKFCAARVSAVDEQAA